MECKHEFSDKEATALLSRPLPLLPAEELRFGWQAEVVGDVPIGRANVTSRYA